MILTDAFFMFQIIQFSSEVLPSWRDGTSSTRRSQILKDWSHLIQEHKEDIGETDLHMSYDTEECVILSSFIRMYAYKYF